MPTTPEDADALFDLAASAAGPAAAPAPASPAATPPASDGAPAIGAENRREQRVKVSWPARVQLPNGRVVELRVRDVSDNGVGLTSPEALPSGVTLFFAMGVPGPSDPSRITPVTASVRVTYAVLKGSDIQCGGTWAQLGQEGRDLIGAWIRKFQGLRTG